jgi:hypothetical protein
MWTDAMAGGFEYGPCLRGYIASGVMVNTGRRMWTVGRLTS